jgi:CheY-like chemotaxis protein
MCLKTLRLLIADDSPQVREMLVHALETEGYQVNGVKDGAEALAKVTEANKSQHHYDAVLLDYAMPEVDGLTCALRIREKEQAESRPEVKIGFFTAYTDLELTPSLLEKLHARSWSKLNLVELIKDLPAWLGAQGA